MKKLILMILSLLLLSGIITGTAAEGTCPLLGEWAYSYAPETLVLRVAEDGSAWYRDTEYSWENADGFLKLTNAAGESILLRYMVSEEQKFIYPATEYHRGNEVKGQGGLIGIWEGVNDGSTFVFTPAGYFLEDSSFSGNYMTDPGQGTFLLHYGDIFADTLCYYSISENDILTVEYPWQIVEKQ